MSMQGTSSSSSRMMDSSCFRNDSSTQRGLRDALLQEADSSGTGWDGNIGIPHPPGNGDGNIRIATNARESRIARRAASPCLTKSSRSV